MNELQKKIIEITKTFEALSSGQSSIITYGDYVISAYHHYSDSYCDIHTYSKSQERFIDEEYDIAIPNLLEKVSDILLGRKEFTSFIKNADEFSDTCAILESNILSPSKLMNLEQRLVQLKTAKNDILYAQSKNKSISYYLWDQLAQTNEEINDIELTLRKNKQSNLLLEEYMKLQKDVFEHSIQFLEEQLAYEKEDFSQQEEER